MEQSEFIFYMLPMNTDHESVQYIQVIMDSIRTRLYRCYIYYIHHNLNI